MNIRTVPATSVLLGIGLFAAALFLTITQFRQSSITTGAVELPTGKVVIAAPVQVLMYAGDHFLAANLEAIRLASIGPTEEESLTAYRIRAHKLIMQLNPCHEDNVYLANAMLSWGGSVDAGNAVLERATECRHWDDIPPFFLGFNRYFFYQDIDGARQAIDIAASRSRDNKAALQHMSIVMASKNLNDEKMAAAYLRSQRDEATDPALREKLGRRLKRLEGLLTLRNAQAVFEQKHHRPLEHPNELRSSGVLEMFPQDPMRIGYEYVDGQFRMRSMIIGGKEIRQ